MTHFMRSAGFGLILLGVSAGCQTTGADPLTAQGGYAGRGYSEGLSGRDWACGAGGGDCGASAEDQAAYQEGWLRGWTRRCENAASIAILRSCETTLGGDWTSDAVARQRSDSRGGRGGGRRSGGR